MYRILFSHLYITKDENVGYQAEKIEKFILCNFIQNFPDGSDGKTFACNAGDQGSIPGLERSPGEGNGNPRQYSCL